MKGEMRLSIRRSITLEVQHSSEMGRYEDGRAGGLLGLRVGMIWASFQMSGIVLEVHDRLKRSERTFIPFGPRCLRCMLEISSGPVAGEFFSRLMVEETSPEENGSTSFGFILIDIFRRVTIQFSLCVSLWLILA